MAKRDPYQESIRMIERLTRDTDQPWIYEVDGDKFLDQTHRKLWGALGSPQELPVTKSKSSGTSFKHQLAAIHDRYDLAGIDLVSNCANQLGAIGVIPAALVDSLILPKIDPAVVEKIFRGLIEGCRRTRVAIKDGRLAEDRGLKERTFILTGTVIGVTEPRLVTKRSKALRAGDELIGIAASGLHCHGYNTIEQLLEDGKLALTQPIPKTKETVLDYLLRPTPFYGPAFEVFKLRVSPESYSINPDEWRSGVACIKHGGIMHNLAAIMPDHLQTVIRPNAWEIPPFYQLLLATGLELREVLSLFNGGLGLIWITRPYLSNRVFEELQDAFKKQGLAVWRIGHLEEKKKRAPKVVLK